MIPYLLIPGALPLFYMELVSSIFDPIPTHDALPLFYMELVSSINDPIPTHADPGGPTTLLNGAGELYQ